MDAFVDNAATVGDEEDEESFDEETGEPRSRTNGADRDVGMGDSSEEEEEDDEEEAAKIAAGFIDDEDEEDMDARRERRRLKKKRRREEREEEGLDEEDLELIGVRTQREETEPKFKRLKRGPREAEDRVRGVDDIFAEEDEEDEADRRPGRLDRRGVQDEFEGFIEEDVFSDEEGQQAREDEEVARPRRRGIADLGLAADAGLDEQAMEDFREAFGDGTDYDFALAAEDEAEEEEQEREKHLDLKDVFEPSQLAEKLLTDEDNVIRITDEPERHQLARKPYKHIQLSDADYREESGWISNVLRAKKNIQSDLQEPFRRAVAQVLDFLVKEEHEVPFIFQNRKDHLIHAVRRPVGRNDDGSTRYEMDANKLLNQNDLWAIFDQDLKFRAFVEKRQRITKTWEDIKTTGRDIEDAVFEDMLPQANTIEELQDLQDYMYFQYSAQIKDVASTATNGDTNGSTVVRKRANASTIYEEIRSSKVYHVVRAFGITADAFAKNALREGVRTYAEDPSETPDNLADQCIDENFSTGARALRAARSMLAEEMVTSPRLRKFMRRNIYMDAVVDCHRTEKGLRRITEDHPYYEFKYLRNQDLRAIAGRPDMFLKMLKAEEEGLVEVKVHLREPERLRKELYKHIVTDAYSDLAEAWNNERKSVVSTAFDKLISIMSRNVKENLKNECEDSIALDLREEFSRKLDQAPYQPRGMKKGTIPRVLALSLGGGQSGRDPVSWAYVSDDGRVLENGSFTELQPGNEERNIADGKDVAALIEVVRRREPEIIGVSGWTPETRKLIANLEEIVRNHNLRGAPYPDEDDRDRSDPLEVVVVNDEVARQYKSSAKAKEQHPGLPELTLYCIALAKYLQDPLKEYAALGNDLVSITFVPAQTLLPVEKLAKAFETSLVDYVNMVGVDLDEAAADAATAKLLDYVAGLGPRKAANLLKAYNAYGSEFTTRYALAVGDHTPLGPRVWANAASTIYLRFESTDDAAEFLDNTRIHPEDYDIARKMAADALELDEEDIVAETRDNGPGAIVRKLIKEDAADRVNDLVLDEYADQLEKDYNARKRSTLENIRAELNDPYEEIRSPFLIKLSEGEVFTMFTGETRDSLQKGMNVPMQIKRVTEASVEGKLDSGIDAYAMEGETTESGVNPKNVYAPHQTVQANIMSIDRKAFNCVVSLREEKTKKPYRRVDTTEYEHDQWDDREEAADRKMLEQKVDAQGRVQRVIKHPLFKPMNSKAAEEYLGSMNRGDLVIRPSSKGNDHLAITWKVADGVFQHIDVLELGKENEFSLGKTLRVGGKYNYSDLDELIVLHVKAMAKKVEEMMNSEKFQDKPKAGLDEWLTTYSNANPKRSIYQFCINRDKPGNFHLCFKAGQNAKLMDWSVKVIPQGFQLMNQPYPDMRNLCNGFKLIFGNMQNASMMRR
ncbi:Transcription elongation factor spt6 [Knufia obscura]|uniref:Transcription elongation factor Spt6 n=1 Tax=Knufia obscura TaxID=1635080 RepID=A0ABR0RPH5_9EURO|nr:Transcription elongation factor spt6 [Knufia obscura]